MLTLTLTHSLSLTHTQRTQTHTYTHAHAHAHAHTHTRACTHTHTHTHTMTHNHSLSRTHTVMERAGGNGAALGVALWMAQTSKNASIGQSSPYPSAINTITVTLGIGTCIVYFWNSYLYISLYQSMCSAVFSDSTHVSKGHWHSTGDHIIRSHITIHKYVPIRVHANYNQLHPTSQHVPTPFIPEHAAI